jgi:hypothetical protein
VEEREASRLTVLQVFSFQSPHVDVHEAQKGNADLYVRRKIMVGIER